MRARFASESLPLSVDASLLILSVADKIVFLQATEQASGAGMTKSQAGRVMGRWQGKGNERQMQAG